MLTPLGVGFIGCMCIGVWRCLGIAIGQVSHLSFCKCRKKKNYEKSKKNVIGGNTFNNAMCQ